MKKKKGFHSKIPNEELYLLQVTFTIHSFDYGLKWVK